jgi:hypothetical protein
MNIIIALMALFQVLHADSAAMALLRMRMRKTRESPLGIKLKSETSDAWERAAMKRVHARLTFVLGPKSKRTGAPIRVRWRKPRPCPSLG